MSRLNPSLPCLVDVEARLTARNDLGNYNFALGASSTTWLMSVPTPCDISTLNSSPSFSVTRGLAVHPTPAGVLYVSTLE